jgi:predicted helicase
MPSQRDRLRKVSTFPSLVKYLQEELDWPIGSDDFEDDLTFDYSPEELGLDPATAAKIDEIKRLRPLTANQPWGIFFVKFEPKRLPSWEMANLILISSYGGSGKREISFAHFTQSAEGSRLPELKVLGWDSRDTALHLDHVADVLAEQFAWPDDEENTDAWLEQWRSAFTLRHRQVITTSQTLSVELAKVARNIRDRINTVLAIESEDGPLTNMLNAFRNALIHDLDRDDFADMYAQTIAYGLLSSRIAKPTHHDLNDSSAITLVTNPFLKELMGTFLEVGQKPSSETSLSLDFDELGVGDVVELLDSADMEAVVLDFGDENPEEDPVIHFYELFLTEYDPEKRMRRGVFYTPRPVVSFIVRSADDLLRTEFGLEDGLADVTTWGEIANRFEDLTIPADIAPDQPFVQILDPATGTGTFLVEVIDLIYTTMLDRWRREGHDNQAINQLWNDYVPQHLLPRLHGYELLMAPYAIAHLKIGLKLHETGFRFNTNERLRVYLTNALTPPSDSSAVLAFTIPALAKEAIEVNKIKTMVPFTVVIGNPPYSDSSQNLEKAHRLLVDNFRYYRGERIREKGAIRFEHVINNDYVKFWGLGLQQLTRTMCGIVCMITSNSFCGGKSFRGLRDSFLNSSQSICITDLHGEGWSGSVAMSGTHDENVFDIQTGVAISCLLKRERSDPTTYVSYGEIVGTYAEKATVLSAGGPKPEYRTVDLDVRKYLSFIPSSGPSRPEYWNWRQLDEWFESSIDGIKTSRDGLVVANTSTACISKIKEFSDLDHDDVDQFGDTHSFSTTNFDFEKAQFHTQKSFDPALVHKFAYRPFDIRYIYYERHLILSHRMNLMPRILDSDATAIVCASRLSSPGFEHAVGTDSLCSNKYSSHDINSRMFPIVFSGEGLHADIIQSNIRPGLLDQAGVPTGPQVERARLLGNYILAILNAPTYRDRYMEEVQQDFPRVPAPKTWEFGGCIATLGEQLMKAHCLDLDVPGDAFPFTGNTSEPATTPRLEGTNLAVGKSSCIAGVKPDIWNFRLAGYQVAKSWLSAGNRSALSRKGAPLSSDLVDQYRSVLWAISETIRIQDEIDSVIEAHGGWPSAFSAV